MYKSSACAKFARLLENNIMEPAVLGQTNGCRATEEASTDGGVRQPRGKSGSSNSSVSFSKELISFSLYGKIPRESKRPWNESLS